jgi:hypothetical protein
MQLDFSRMQLALESPPLPREHGLPLVDGRAEVRAEVRSQLAAQARNAALPEEVGVGG